MAGVGRRSDFGKPEYDEADIENRLDTTDPLFDESLPFEQRVKSLMDRGMSREKAVEWVKHAEEDRKKLPERRKQILKEQTAFRKQIGDLKYCTPIDESCMPE